MKDLAQRDAIDTQSDQILAQIRALEVELMGVLRTDPDYDAYCVRCEANGQRPCLPVRTFWHHLDQMNWIEENEPSETDRRAAYWRKHRAEHERHTRALGLR